MAQSQAGNRKKQGRTVVRNQGVEDSNKRRTPFRSEMPQLLSYQHSILTTLKVDVH